MNVGSNRNFIFIVVFLILFFEALSYAESIDELRKGIVKVSLSPKKRCTGFVVCEENGYVYILTSDHFNFNKQQKIYITDYRNKTAEAEFCNREERTGIAILKANKKDIPHTPPLQLSTETESDSKSITVISFDNHTTKK